MINTNWPFPVVYGKIPEDDPEQYQDDKELNQSEGQAE